MEAAGYASLFLSAFLASTLVPLSSESVLASLVAAEGFRLLVLVAVATGGNVLGAVVNWSLGRYCLHWRDRRWFPVSPAALDRAGAWFARYGTWTLLLSWLPVIGDPLTFAAGILRVRLSLFLILVTTGKLARYVVVAAIAVRWLT